MPRRDHARLLLLALSALALAGFFCTLSQLFEPTKACLCWKSQQMSVGECVYVCFERASRGLELFPLAHSDLPFPESHFEKCGSMDASLLLKSRNK